MTVILRLAATPSPYRMGVVETNQPFAIGPMQCQRVIKTVRLFRRSRDAVHDEAHPMSPGRIDDKDLTVQIQQSVERGIAWLRHGM